MTHGPLSSIAINLEFDVSGSRIQDEDEGYFVPS